MNSTGAELEPDPPCSDKEQVGSKLDRARGLLKEYLELNTQTLSRDLVNAGS